MGYTLKLISEHIEQDTDYLIEQDEKGNKNYKIKGIFMQADIKNRNGRIYPMEILQKEVKRYNKDYINEKRAFGELGHPDGPTVNLERASHMITALYPDGKNFIGEAKVLSHTNIISSFGISFFILFRSTNFNNGFDGVSIHINFVFFLIRPGQLSSLVKSV